MNQPYEQDTWAQLVDELNQAPKPTGNIDGAIKRITKQLSKEKAMRSKTDVFVATHTLGKTDPPTKQRKSRTTYEHHNTQIIRVSKSDEGKVSRVGHLQIDGQTVSVYSKGAKAPIWKGKLHLLIELLGEL